MLAERIIQLEGVPVLDPSHWVDLARCKYSPPIKNDVSTLLKQNIAAERCAVIRYEEIATFTNNIDYTTCDIAKRITKMGNKMTEGMLMPYKKVMDNARKSSGKVIAEGSEIIVDALSKAKETVSAK